MSASSIATGNSLGGGYRFRWVLFGGRAAGWGISLGGSAVLGGWAGAILAVRIGLACRAAGLAGLAASISIFQALSAAALGIVATGPSQRASAMADFRAFRVAGRLIASFRTRHLGELEAGPIGAEADQAGGVVPPSPIARTPYAPRARRDGNLTISDRKAGTWPARTMSPSGSRFAGNGRLAKVSRWPMGSGVRVAQASWVLGEVRRAKGPYLRNRVGVAGSHRAFDLGRNGEIIMGRG